MSKKKMSLSCEYLLHVTLEFVACVEIFHVRYKRKDQRAPTYATVATSVRTGGDSG